MRTLALTDPFLVRHDPGPEHPERPERLGALLEVLARAPLAGVEVCAPRPATRAELATVHAEPLLAELERAEGKTVQLDPDTGTSPDSVQAARLAAGAAVQAVEEVWAGRADNAFALVRPPGHHAEPGRAMGFCLVNNAAVAAEAARRLGAQRVLVFDWDVHHGNGTQAAFYGRRDVLYQSVHEYPFYPGTGGPFERGSGAGEGFTVNCGVPPGCTDHDYGALLDGLFLPVAEAYRPDLVIVSAGYDPHRADPLGDMLLTERGFAAMASRMRQLAERTAGGKLVMVLEGGYDLDALAQSVHATLEVMAGRNDEFPAGGTSPQAAHALALSRRTLAPYWPGVLR